MSGFVRSIDVRMTPSKIVMIKISYKSDLHSNSSSLHPINSSSSTPPYPPLVIGVDDPTVPLHGSPLVLSPGEYLSSLRLTDPLPSPPSSVSRSASLLACLLGPTYADSVSSSSRSEDCKATPLFGSRGVTFETSFSRTFAYNVSSDPSASSAAAPNESSLSLSSSSSHSFTAPPSTMITSFTVAADGTGTISSVQTQPLVSSSPSLPQFFPSLSWYTVCCASSHRPLPPRPSTPSRRSPADGVGNSSTASAGNRRRRAAEPSKNDEEIALVSLNAQDDDGGGSDSDDDVEASDCPTSSSSSSSSTSSSSSSPIFSYVSENGSHFTHFSSEHDARAFLDSVTRHQTFSGASFLASHLCRSSSSRSSGVGGSPAVLVDSRKQVLLSSRPAGSDVVCERRLRDACITEGYLLSSPSVGAAATALGTLKVLQGVLSEPADGRNFAVVTALLGTSAYLDIYTDVLLGVVLTMFGPSPSIEEPGKIDKYGWTTSLYCGVFTCKPPTTTDGGGVGGDDSSRAPLRREALICAYLFLNLLKTALYVSNVYVHSTVCDAKNAAMRSRSFKHVLSLDQSFFDVRALGDIRSAMCCEAVNNLVSWNVPYLITRVAKLLFSVAFMFAIDYRLGAIAVGSMLALKYGVLEPMAALEVNVGRVQRSLTVKNDLVMDEAIDMISTIKLFSREELHAEKYGKGQETYRKHMKVAVVLRCVREFGYELLLAFSFFVVLLFYLHEAVSSSNSSKQTLSGAELVSFFFIFKQFQSIVGNIKWHWDMLVKDLPDVERFLALMAESPKVVVAGPATSLSSDSPFGNNNNSSSSSSDDVVIALEDVAFAYPSRPLEPALRGVSFSFPPRSMTAIVGDSGSGKTTLVKLITRLYDPTGGAVTIGGKDLKTIDTKDLHSYISVVPQSPDLFNASIKDNITYGVDRDVPMSEVIEAAKAANCYDFITSLKAGFDTFAGPRGAQLSVGQKQRIAIARAFVRCPSVLICDEATSSLDSVNEEAVKDAMDRLMRGRTTIVIAHRLSTIQQAGVIIVMKKGEIVETGTAKDLMDKKGAYYNLVKKQTAL